MRYLSELADRLAQRFNALEKYVVGSGISPSLSRYFENLIKLFIPIMFLALTTVTSALNITQAPNMGLVGMLTAVLLSAAATAFAFVLVAVTLPKLLHMNRGYRLEAKYPAFLYIFSLLLTSGLGPTKALLELNKFKDLEPFRIELEAISNGLHLGKSLDEVINNLVVITPCRSLVSLLTAVQGVVKSGYDPMPVVNSLIERYFAGVRARVEEMVNFMGMLSEAFAAVALLLPLVVSVIASTTSLVPIGIINPYLLLIITALVIVPASSLVYYILIDYVMSSVEI